AREGRRDRAHEGARVGAGHPWDHGQQHPARHDRHADVAPRRSRRRPRKSREARVTDDPRRPDRSPRRDRGGVRIPLFRRSDLHHRPGDRRQRRHGPVNHAAERMPSPKPPKQHPNPPEGTWTEHYRELGTAPVSYESSISPEFYALEREAVFKRAWLNVGRVEQLRRKGGFFTKELAVASTSLIVVRGMDDEIRAFHNVVLHRGNKQVWTDHPAEEISGTCRQF